MLKRLIVPLAVLFFVLACISAPTAVPDQPATEPPNSPSQTPSIDPSHLAHLPDPALTPGDVMSVSITDICTPGYSSRVRAVPDSVKKQVYLEYGITSHQPGAYEVDHLISLELGGSNSIKNLWPEPYTGDLNAHVKDKLENKLHDMVCNGEINLESAQREIATDWVAAYLKYVGQP